ncbi:MAG: helix-turn-helix transcriptional regulator [Spirochaetales bacterium]|nr:helix-turn-helix transcriptional regulator [Spirochaetales bacterium]
MPRTPEENERIKQERKDKILMAALRIFAENGLAAARMSDIARAAGVSYGLVYNYF